MKNIPQFFTAVATVTSGLVFVGHGALAVQADQQWVGLFYHSLRFLPGGSPDLATVTSLTQSVGIADVLFGFLLIGLGVYFFTTAATALSRLIAPLLFIAAFWQFMTSSAFIIANGTLSPGIWHLFERSASVALPLLGAISILAFRRK